jgi:enoyl-[acyl-carrier protein] reductase/trans-2-enoyl-CoA reductase (NAD+)
MPRRVLVVGASTGLGLAARLIAIGEGSHTIGVCHSRPGAPDRPGSAGWYATAEVHALAEAAGSTCRTVLADAFSNQAKNRVVRTIRDTLGQVDLVVYSIAARRRRHPDTGRQHRTTIAALGEAFSDKTFDLATMSVRYETVPVASPEQVTDTIAVMGGDDWARWWTALGEADVLAAGARSIAFSYQGGELLWPTYRGGTLGAAKDHLEATACRLDTPDRPVRVAVTSAHVTQSSSIIPMASLYWSLLTRLLDETGLAEGPLDQMHRLFREVLIKDKLDGHRRLRLDDRELNRAVQDELSRRWAQVTTDNLPELGSPERYALELLQGNGFAIDGVDYDADVDPVVPIEGVIHCER